jgi:hypothetical protein
MGSRTCTNPEDTVDTSGQLVPDLLNPPTTSDPEDEEQPLDSQPVGPQATPARPSDINAPLSHDHLALEPRSPSSNTARAKSNAKGKEKKKNRGWSEICSYGLLDV